MNVVVGGVMVVFSFFPKTGFMLTLEARRSSIVAGSAAAAASAAAGHSSSMAAAASGPAPGSRPSIWRLIRGPSAAVDAGAPPAKPVGAVGSHAVVAAPSKPASRAVSGLLSPLQLAQLIMPSFAAARGAPARPHTAASRTREREREQDGERRPHAPAAASGRGGGDGDGADAAVSVEGGSEQLHRGAVGVVAVLGAEGNALTTNDSTVEPAAFDTAFVYSSPQGLGAGAGSVRGSDADVIVDVDADIDVDGVSRLGDGGVGGGDDSDAGDGSGSEEGGGRPLKRRRGPHDG
jgi:hypothetical protein